MNQLDQGEDMTDLNKIAEKIMNDAECCWDRDGFPDLANQKWFKGRVVEWLRKSKRLGLLLARGCGPEPREAIKRGSEEEKAWKKEHGVRFRSKVWNAALAAKNDEIDKLLADANK